MVLMIVEGVKSYIQIFEFVNMLIIIAYKIIFVHVQLFCFMLKVFITGPDCGDEGKNII